MADETKNLELTDEELEQAAGGGTFQDLTNQMKKLQQATPTEERCPYCNKKEMVTPEDGYIPAGLIMFGEDVRRYSCTTSKRVFFVEHLPNGIRHVYDENGQLKATVL